MRFNLILIFFFTLSCAQNMNIVKNTNIYNSKGFAYVYKEEDYLNKILKKKLDNNLSQIAHFKLKPGTLIKIINPRKPPVYIP